MTNTISTDTLTTIREALDELGETGAHRVHRGDLQTRTEENASWQFVCAWPEQIDAVRTEAGAHGDLDMVQLCDEAAHDTDALRRVLDALEDARAQQDGQVRTLRADDLLKAIAKTARSADTDREPLSGLQTSSQLAWNVIRQWAQGDGSHHVQDGTYYVTTADGAHWRIVVDQGRATVADAGAQHEGANTYALIANRGDDRAEALDVWVSEHDAGHPDVIADAQRRVGAAGGFARVTWVSVDGPCKVGDTLDVSGDGDATVVE